MSQPKVLFVLTSQSKIDSTGKPTGWYLPEFAHPYQVLAPHADITVASPAGGEAPLDPASVEMFKSDTSSVDFLNSKQALWKNTEKLEDFVGRAGEFAALIYVGGHGPMFDLAHSPASHALISAFASSPSSPIISAVCHGPAALAYAKLSSGAYLIANAPITGFSNAEEDTVGMTQAMPFSLEDALNENSGGKYEKAADAWGEKVVVAMGGKLITGQNPASARAMGERVLEGIKGGK
ncbi:hypothetical protein MMC20_002654 [Loxospora ochrophaea]|nr:hypothetical protein [Loxospora ochrophaea]